MLWSASTLRSFAIGATDGAIGGVSDLLFDDKNWSIRWLVVDTGSWLPGRKVILPPSLLEKPNEAARQFPVRLTMSQVKDSPPLELDEPVSRAAEGSIFDYYGVHPYWDDGLMSMQGAMALPLVPPLPFADDNGDQATIDEAAAAAKLPGDPHLRSAAYMTGQTLNAREQKIGEVDDFLIDDSGWTIRYIVADSGGWFSGRKFLLPATLVADISGAEGALTFDIDEQKLKATPEYDPATPIVEADEQSLLAFYGVGRLDK